MFSIPKSQKSLLKPKGFPKIPSFCWKHYDWKRNISMQNCSAKRLRQIECAVQNGPVTENGVLPLTALLYFIENFDFSMKTSKNWFNIPATQTTIFVLFVSASVLFKCPFSL